jgi:hypothetical protein
MKTASSIKFSRNLFISFGDETCGRTDIKDLSIAPQILCALCEGRIKAFQIDVKANSSIISSGKYFVSFLSNFRRYEMVVKNACFGDFHA